jgi:pimeloyl-[acyl-carrier protein] methyl ester esterase
VSPEKAIWGGWSLGGLLATQFALDHPGKVTKLICVASTPKFVKEAHWPGMDAPLLNTFAQQLEVDYEATLMRFLILQFYGQPHNKKMIQWLQSSLFRYGKPTVSTLQAGLNLLGTTDLRNALSQLTCPVLYLLGKLDRLVPSQIATLLRQLNSNSRVVIFPKASHAPFLSHEDEFLTEIRRFAHE